MTRPRRPAPRSSPGVALTLALLTAAAAAAAAAEPAVPARAQVLDAQRLLDAQTFWDNRDWDWYKANVPAFESPDPDLDTTYYYRWELLTKHLTYGSPATGYTFTEFLDRPPWSGRYGAISCPAGHQLYEARWLKDPRYARDFARYWFKTPGAQPRNYSTWLADAVWAAHLVHPDARFVTGLLPDLVRNYEGWEARHFVPAVGLFWQTGHDDGMEYNINSRQTRDTLRGAPAFRPTLNSYLWADARAIARVADLAAEPATARAFRARADALKANLQKALWDPRRRFFFPMSRDDEERDGRAVKAGSLTYQTGRYAGDPHGRELIGLVPWQFGLPDPGFEPAWAPLMSPDGFFAPFGPTVVERHDPLFLVTKSCCYWSGQSWPYATTQTLKAMANLLQTSAQDVVTRADYLELLGVFARTHRKAGRPYLAEGADPDTGSFAGYDSFNHSEHYFHSGYVDLIVTGLAGLRPRDDDTLEVDPLAPAAWPYFALDDLPYHGHRVAIVWDRDGTRYSLGKGFHLRADGRTLATSPTLTRLVATLPPAPRRDPAPDPVNVAVNNDGGYFPRVTASRHDPAHPPGKLVDGNIWYHASPPNRWTFAGPPAAGAGEPDRVGVDFGVARTVDTVKLYFLDDGEGVVPPASLRLELETAGGRVTVPGPAVVRGRAATVVRFPAVAATAARAVVTHRPGATSGLSEFEVWGDGAQPVHPAPPPPGDLALNPGDRPFPKATASFTSRFDRPERANDGLINFAPNPNNRWTAYESPAATDWLQIDFGRETEFGRVELALYDDGGGVRAPTDYALEYQAGGAWKAVPGQERSPARPAGGQFNEIRFPRVKADKLRVVFTHKSPARSGLTEILVWP